MTFREDFIAGGRDLAPLLPAGAVVGAVTGIAAAAVGLPPVQAITMAVVVYYPTVMLTAFALLEAVTPAIVLIVTALVVGARSLLYSLSLAPHFSRFSHAWKWFLAYFLWTPVYAFSIGRYESNPPSSKRGYYLGTAVPLWITIQLSFVVGLFFGAGVPPEWQLDFVIPLAFIALVMRFLEDVQTVAAALVAGVLVVLSAGLPFNLGFIVAAIGGSAAGLFIANARSG